MICIFFIGMLVAELTHFVFPFVEDGTFHYFFGMHTAALPLIPASIGFRRLLANIAAQKAALPSSPTSTSTRARAQNETS
jgi:hypothetical protein